MASRKESNLFLTFTAWNKVIIEKQKRAKFFFSSFESKKADVHGCLFFNQQYCNLKFQSREFLQDTDPMESLP